MGKEGFDGCPHFTKLLFVTFCLNMEIFTCFFGTILKINGKIMDIS